MQIASIKHTKMEPEGALIAAYGGLHDMGAYADSFGLSHLLSSLFMA
jgi:hypothetical protein